MLKTKYGELLRKPKPSTGITSQGASSFYYCGTFSGCKYPSRFNGKFKGGLDIKTTYIEHDESVPQLNG